MFINVQSYLKLSVFVFPSIYLKFIYYNNLSVIINIKMRNLKVVFPEGSAFENYKFTIDEDLEELEEKLEKKKIKKENSEEFED